MSVRPAKGTTYNGWKSHPERSIKKGNEYATLTSSVRDGEKALKGESINLGRVLDKERGIFRSRERRGIYL